MSRASIELAHRIEPITRPSRLTLKGAHGPWPQEEPHASSASANDTATEQLAVPGKGTTAVVFFCVVCSTTINALLHGVVTVVLPAMVKDLQLDHRLLLCVLQSVLSLACGLARDGVQLIVFRAFAGIAISFCLPSVVSIITSTFPEGKRRNIASASIGGGQPVGFSLGLTLGGVIVDTIGWLEVEQHNILGRLKHDIEWIGVLISSLSLAMLSSMTSSHSNITDPATLAVLIISILLILVFIFWVGRQEKLGRPAIISNSLWRNRVFTTICIGVFAIWGLFNAVETFQSLFFQEVQEISALRASIQFLPAPIVGTFSNIVIGLLVHLVRADWLIVFGTGLTCLAALLMAVIQPEWSYWACAFPAIVLNPPGADTLFTVSNLVITGLFPTKTQALAGGVFSTIAQIGKSVGLATSAVISNSVTTKSGFQNKEAPAALMEGYRAAFWYCFAGSCATGLLFAWGLRGIGRVGVKRE
ncbi:major facilitator superfamily domain-containing protein [Clohesyomyces aquaticus]|uniref:Major facilitator superfamily domain-containing protein n=1 Tax=Clohesyomyces aquaticus TaxID=1231657 RepID=A0A1Y1ZNH5_9PLEO|nr:major facilitator superfamily domain-containing protein [Clohesyomyces aquaticus]